jgi:preprotein translocase subunit SecD
VRRAIVLIALVAATACRKHAPGAGPPGPRPKLEVVLVDDSVDPLSGVDESVLPRGSRIDRADVPAGPGIVMTVHYARIVAGAGETVDGATARLDAALAKVTVPPDHRFAFAPAFDEASPRPVAARSYLLTGAPILRETDVTDADAILGEDGHWTVAVTLSAAAAKRFEDATRLDLKKRLAIVVDGRVRSVPVLQGVIGGGHIQITMGQDDDQKRDAQQLARGLGGR